MATTLFITAAAVAVIAALVSAVVRIVPADHCAVVTRMGRPARTRAARLVVVLPLVERVKTLPLQASTLGPLEVSAQTRDGIRLHFEIGALWCIADPLLAAQARPNLQTAVTETVEHALRQLVACVDLVDLLPDHGKLIKRLPVTALPLVQPLGVQILDLDLMAAHPPSDPNTPGAGATAV